MMPDVHYPNSSSYPLLNTYWSTRQSDVHPRCFFTPRSTTDVSRALKMLMKLRAPFTVRGSGHTAFPESSNIEDAVTIDLRKMNQIAVSMDQKTVSVGPGNRWVDVSEALDLLGLAVVGGRSATVGVGGLILGGGISYFSGRYGWACDNVNNFEIVLLSGNVVNANAGENADLFWALRGGGGSSWGIVTRFDLASFEQGELWTSSIVYDGATANKSLLPMVTDMATWKLNMDDDAHAYFVQTYDRASGRWLFLASFFHAAPPTLNVTPPVFGLFDSVPGVIRNETRRADVSTLTRLVEEPVGLFRKTWWDTTISAARSEQLLGEITRLYEGYVSKIVQEAGNRTFTPFLVLQPITDNVITQMQKNGGNALGLYPEDGPLIMVQLSSSWADAALDTLIESSSKEFIDKVESMASARGLHRGFVYINYAGKSQDVLRRYGPKNHQRLRDIAEKWDSGAFGRRLWKGYFQLLPAELTAVPTTTAAASKCFE
ncbi:hypothetical protein EsDP_00001542 [Epichloe bromicola]|uniref:FAD-binding PCMH-type domain-containing protein n=1 Tax=Epichloe bromicola TaxID=79588 RepID=A0ABQ0CI62_9HYPO